MSAWLVTKRHIDVLTYGMVKHGIIILSERDKIGRMLWSENYRSIRARYGVDEHNRRRPPYECAYPPFKYQDDIVIFKQAGCYQYQSCEHNGWARSDSKWFTDVLISRTAQALGHIDPGTVYERPDYRTAPWGV